MRFNKKDTRFLSMLMAVAICLSLSVTAFAAEAIPDEESTPVVVTDETGSPVPLAGAGNNQLVDFGGRPLRGTYHYYICPPKGATLKFVVNNAISSDTSSVKVETTKNGGWWPSNTTTIPKSQAAKTYTLISNCNGETYTVKFTADNGYFAGTLYWTT